MRKSPEVNLSSFKNLTSGSENSSCEEMDSDTPPDGRSHTLTFQQQLSKVALQDFGKCERLSLPTFKGSDFGIAALNTPFLPKAERASPPVECVFLMCASSSYFPKYDCEYHKGRPLIFMWKDCSNTMASDFANHAQAYFKDQYLALRPRLRFLNQIDPTLDKLNNLAMLRRDVPSGRILYHYIGFGSPPLNETSIPCLDRKTGLFGHFMMKNLFESIRPPSFFLFDCDNSASALMTLQGAEAMKREEKRSSSLYMNRPIDWSDWFFIGATDVGECLPSDPHLPRDFLTACLFTPVKLALVCHILQHYRASVKSEQFPLDMFNDKVLSESSELGKDLLDGLTAVIDAIAVESLSVSVYKKLFRNGPLMRVAFQRFLLLQYLLRPHQVHPVSRPQLPDLSTHHLWQHWDTMADLAVASCLKPTCSVSGRLFQAAKRSMKGYLIRREESMITKSMVAFVFHGIEFTQKLSPVKWLAKFASCSDISRKVLAESLVFGSLFSWLGKCTNDKQIFHGLCYLIVVFLRENPAFVHELKYDEGQQVIPQLLFDKTIPQVTRGFVAAILATLVSVNERIRSTVVSRSYLAQVSQLLGESDSMMTLWLLLLLRRMFDSYGVEVSALYDLGMFAQVASFTLHDSCEIRGAAISLMSCLIQTGEDMANAQLAFFALLCLFDGAYCVRYNLVLFLGQFLSIYMDAQSGTATASDESMIYGFYSRWFHHSLNPADLASMDTLAEILDTFLQDVDFLSQITRAVREAVVILKDDPHPDVRAAGEHIVTRHKLGPDGHEIKHYRQDKILSETGGDALYYMCMGQLVTSAQWQCPTRQRKSSTIPDALPSPVLSNIPTTSISTHTRFRIPGCRITHITYHTTSLSLAVAASDNRVRFHNEQHVESVFQQRTTISSLSIVDWFHHPLVLTGCTDGCLSLWDPTETTPRLCMRADYPADTRNDLVIAPFRTQPQVATSRGASGTIRLWDIETQRLISEWASGATERVTSIAVNAHGADTCAAGFMNGLIVLLDLRCNPSSGPQRISVPRAGEEVFKIVCGLSSTSFIGATRQGSCVQWDDLENPTFIQYEGSTLKDFDAHSHSPLLVFSPKTTVPVITDVNGRIIHTVRATGANSSCAFHSILPMVAFGTTSGEIIECELT